MITLIGVVLAAGRPAGAAQIGVPAVSAVFHGADSRGDLQQLTFPLQILASRLAAGALTVLGIPVMREGNILDLPNQRLSVVEACSGIRSLLSLTFLSLVYGYFFEKRTWLRVVLFLATIPVADPANAGRVTVTGILSEIRSDLAEGFFHESTGHGDFHGARASSYLLLHKCCSQISQPANRPSVDAMDIWNSKYMRVLTLVLLLQAVAFYAVAFRAGNRATGSAADRRFPEQLGAWHMVKIFRSKKRCWTCCARTTR